MCGYCRVSIEGRDMDVSLHVQMIGILRPIGKPVSKVRRPASRVIFTPCAIGLDQT